MLTPALIWDCTSLKKEEEVAPQSIGTNSSLEIFARAGEGLDP